MSKGLLTETHWLELIEASKLIGIVLLDGDGKPTQVFVDDPALRLMITDYWKERVRLQALYDHSQVGERTYPSFAG